MSTTNGRHHVNDTQAGGPDEGAEETTRNIERPTIEDIERWLSVSHPANHAIEIRAPGRKVPGSDRAITVVQRFTAGAFRKAAAEAYKLSGTAPAVYVVMNGIDPALPRTGRLKGGASAKDIPRRNRLLIDCDPDRPADTNSTEEEKAEALRLAARIHAALRDRGWPEPVSADSGNGHHLVYALDLPNDDESNALVKAVLAALADRFDTAAAGVDRKVFDAPRLVKLYGTLAAKGEDTADRPRRYARVLTAPAELAPVPTELLRELAAEATPAAPDGVDLGAEIERKRTQASASAPAATRKAKAGQPDAGTRAAAYLDRCAPAISGNKGHNAAFKAACKIGPGFDLTRDETLRLLRERFNPRCEPPWSDRELEHKVDDAFKVEPRRGWLLNADRNGLGGGGTAGNGKPPAAPPPPNVTIDAAEPIKPNEAADDPHRLARIVLSKFTHPDGPTLAHFRESFHVWEGTYYKADPHFISVTLVNEVKAELDRHNLIAVEAWRREVSVSALAGTPGRSPGPPVARKVTRVLVANVAQALAAMTSVDRDSEPPFWVDPQAGDPDPLTLVPARNALVKLSARSAVCLPHSPRLFSSYALPYDYEPDAPPPAEWLRFLDSQWAGDPASTRELQKWFGLMLTLEIKYQKILLLVGPPRSGRSTAKDVMTKMIGRRNVAATSAAALSDRFGLEPFLGKTLAIMGDARTGDTHDTAILMDRVLRISGCDPVEVNRKGRPILFDVLMRTRLVIISNEMPNFRDNSGAIVARYLPLLMTENFEGREDLDLGERLGAELPSILNWAIQGRAMLEQDGRFNVPQTALHLLEDAKSLASPVAAFVSEECCLHKDAEVSIDDMWKRWKEWAERNGHKPGTKQLFGRNLKPATNYKVTTGRPRSDEGRPRIYRGIELKLVLKDGKPY